MADLCHPLLWGISTFLVLAALAGLAFSLRYEIAVNDPLWIDELHTTWTAGADPEAGLGDIGRRAAAGNQTPLYFWVQFLLNRECSFWFSGERLGFRGLSLLAGGSLILGGGMWVWLQTRSMAGAALTGSLFAFDEVQHFYSTEARPYECLALVGLVQVLSLWSCWQRRGSRAGRLAALSLSSLALVVLHPAGALLVVAELITLVVRLVPASSFAERKATLASTLPLIGSLALLAMSWPSLGQTVANRDLWASIAQPGAALLGVALPVCLFMFSAAAIGLVGKGWRMDSRSKDAVGQAVVLTLLAAFVALLVQAFQWSGLAPLALPRYQAAVWGLMPVALGLLTGAAARERMEWAVPACIFVFFAAVPLPFFGSPETGWRTMRGAEVGAKLFESHPRMRYENWGAVESRILWDCYSSVPQYLDARYDIFEWPVFLLPNLLEDGQLRVPNLAIASALKGPATISIEEYSGFPLFRLDQTLLLRIFPRSTLAGPRFSAADFDWLQASPHGYLVVRGSDSIARDAVNELAEIASLTGLSVKTTRLEQAGRNVVQVWRLSVRPAGQAGGKD